MYMLFLCGVCVVKYQTSFFFNLSIMKGVLLMKKKFNILALLMVTIMAITLVGCGSKDNDTNNNDNTEETIEDAAESVVDVVDNVDDDKNEDTSFEDAVVDDEKQPTDDDNHDITEPAETEPEEITSIDMNNFTYNIPEGYEIVNQSATEITLTNPDVPYVTIVVSNDNTDALAALYAHKDAVESCISKNESWYVQYNNEYTAPVIDDIFASAGINELPATSFMFGDGNDIMHTRAEMNINGCMGYIYYAFYDMPSMDALNNLVPLDSGDAVERTIIIYYPVHHVANNTIITPSEAVTVRFIIDPYESNTWSGNYAAPIEITRVANDLMLYMIN